jgi:hypothetical protein
MYLASFQDFNFPVTLTYSFVSNVTSFAPPALSSPGYSLQQHAPVPSSTDNNLCAPVSSFETIFPTIVTRPIGFPVSKANSSASAEDAVASEICLMVTGVMESSCCRFW